MGWNAAKSYCHLDEAESLGQNDIHKLAPLPPSTMNFVGLDLMSLSIGTATAGSDVVQSGRPIFDDFFQHLWLIRIDQCCLPNGHFVAYPHRPMTHSPTENSLAVLNHKILEANTQVQNVKLGGHQTCLSIN
ncbi:hypothetical protein TNCV_3836871 [Trichonephila clavipes]|nr:hypothetical protein TNCV_3836871 [Trichonephila clavipes]